MFFSVRLENIFYAYEKVQMSCCIEAPDIYRDIKQKGDLSTQDGNKVRVSNSPDFLILR